MFFWGHPWCFGSLGKFQHNIKISVKTAHVSSLSFHFLWLCFYKKHLVAASESEVATQNKTHELKCLVVLNLQQLHYFTKTVSRISRTRIFSVSLGIIIRRKSSESFDGLDISSSFVNQPTCQWIQAKDEMQIYAFSNYAELWSMLKITQVAFSCSKQTIQTLEKG